MQFLSYPLLEPCNPSPLIAPPPRNYVIQNLNHPPLVFGRIRSTPDASQLGCTFDAPFPGLFPTEPWDWEFDVQGLAYVVHGKGGRDQ